LVYNLPLPAHKDIVGSLEEGKIGDRAKALFTVNLIQPALQEREMILAQKYIVVAEPPSPKSTCRAPVTDAALRGVLAGEVEIHDAEKPAGLENGKSVFYRLEPVRDHG